MQRGGSFERADSQRTGRCSLVGDCALGVFEQACGTRRERKQPRPGRRQRDPAIGSLEQGEPDLILQGFDARGDVRLHGVQFECGLVHAAGSGNGLEDFQIGGVHLEKLLSHPMRSYRIGARRAIRPPSTQLSLRAGIADNVGNDGAHHQGAADKCARRRNLLEREPYPKGHQRCLQRSDQGGLSGRQ